MRKIVLVLAGCLVLSGCTFAWEGEIRFKVTEIDEHYQPYNAAPEETCVLLEVTEIPSSANDRKNFTKRCLEPTEIEGTVAVGDEVVCAATQEGGHAFKYNSYRTELSGCRKA